MTKDEQLFDEYYDWLKYNLVIVGHDCPTTSVDSYFNCILIKANRLFVKNINVELFRLAYTDVVIELIN